jgi:hypothetical protein
MVSSCSGGKIYEEIASVTMMVLCPSNACTIFGCVPMEFSCALVALPVVPHTAGMKRIYTLALTIPKLSIESDY